MSDFVVVAKLSEIPDPGKLLVEVEDRLVVVFRIGNEVYCLEDVCTHDGGTLGDGMFKDTTIACTRHGAKFDIRDGKALTMPATEDTQAHDAKIEGDDVLVRLREPGDESAVDSPATSAQSSSASALSADSSSTSSSSSTTSAAAPPATGGRTSLHEDTVREELKKVIDPELFVNIVDLGLIYVVDVKDRDDNKYDVSIEMTMTSPACPAGPQLISNSKNVVSQLEQVEEVEVKIVMDPPWTPDKMTEDARDQLGIF
ncbi:MAG: Rieske 2Fe-2S domain-containing protein [Planctomycetota bacterium]